MWVMLVFIPFFFRFAEHVHPYLELSLIILLFKGELNGNDILYSFPSLASTDMHVPITIHCSIHLYILCYVDLIVRYCHARDHSD